MKPFIQVKNLKKYFPVQKSFIQKLLTRKPNYIHAVDDVSFNINRKEIFGLVGESGSGKTTTGKLLLRLIEPTSGEVLINDVNIFSLKKEELRRFRRHIQIIFQDVKESLNPRIKIGDILLHSLKIHNIGRDEKDRKNLVLEALENVGLSPPQSFYDKYPHQISGGQRQRVAIARAMILRPDFLVADEPIANIDVSLRAQILDLLLRLRENHNMTILYITHDLATSKYICDTIAVMYLGKIVEWAARDEIYTNPLHPYTVALLSSVPIPDPRFRSKHIILRGEIPSSINPPSGCRLHPRCSIATEKCSQEEPILSYIKNNHYVACHYFGKISLIKRS
jgi:peptide/nickel transport system ATP-binding protein